jgi:hypothetical protein
MAGSVGTLRSFRLCPNGTGDEPDAFIAARQQARCTFKQPRHPDWRPGAEPASPTEFI